MSSFHLEQPQNTRDGWDASENVLAQCTGGLSVSWAREREGKTVGAACFPPTHFFPSFFNLFSNNLDCVSFPEQSVPSITMILPFIKPPIEF